MKTILWNTLAVQDYQENIDYLLGKWSAKVAIAYSNEVDAMVFDLQQGIIEFKDIGYRDMEQGVVRKLVTLYYSIMAWM